MTPDVNVLVAGFRADHSHDETARAWLTKARRNCLQGSESLTVLPMVMVCDANDRVRDAQVDVSYHC